MTTINRPKSMDSVERDLEYLQTQAFLENEENLSELNQAAILAVKQQSREAVIEKLLRYDHIISRIFYSRQISVDVVGGRENYRYQAILIKSMCELVLHEDGDWLRQYFQYVKHSELKLRSFLVIMLDYYTYHAGNVDAAFEDTYTKLDVLIDEVTTEEAPDRALASAVLKTIEYVQKHGSSK